MDISWHDHITNGEAMARIGQAALHDTVATRRRRFVGHILRLPTTRPASLAIMWRPEGGRRRVGRPKRTWQDTLKEDLDTLGVDRNDARDTANDRASWRSEREELSLSLCLRVVVCLIPILPIFLDLRAYSSRPAAGFKGGLASSLFLKS